MVKKLANIFIFLSVVITVSHSIISHHHHFGTIVAESRNHDDGDANDQNHNLFSFGKLDESYTQSNNQLSLNNNFVFISIVHQFTNLQLIADTDKQDFSCVKDYHPSDNPNIRSHELRGPPVS